MSLKCRMGVHDVAYSDPDASGATTTGDVAEILERRYGVMRVFDAAHYKQVRDGIDNYLQGMIESVAAGKSARSYKTMQLSKVESAFRDYLTTGEWEKITGRQIAAAKRGVNLRKKSKKNKGQQERPAFVRTGLYASSFFAKIGK